MFVAEQVQAGVSIPSQRKVQWDGILLALRGGEFALKDENGIVCRPILGHLSGLPSSSNGLRRLIPSLIRGGQTPFDFAN
jgi:hypothetical protein